MSLQRLKWVTIILPIAFMLLLQLCLMFFLEPRLGRTPGHWAALGIVAVAVVLFSTAIFKIVDTMQRRIIRQNEELSALNAVGRAVSGSLDAREAISAALQNVMEVTRAAAAQVAVEWEEDGPPLRLAQGSSHALDWLHRLHEAGCGRDAPPNEPRIVDLRLAAEPAAGEALAQGFGAFARVPLRAGNRQFGVMMLLAGDGGHLNSEDSDRLLAAMGNQIATAIQAGHLFQDVLRRGKEARALYEIGLNIASLQDIQSILRSIVEQARQVLGTEAAGLCLASGDSGVLTLADSAGPPEAFKRSPGAVQPLPLVLGSVPDDLIRSGPDSPCPAHVAGYSGSCLSAPLRVGASTIGELCVSSPQRRRFTERHRDLLGGLADMAAIAINNARLLERERYVAVLEERERLAREMHDSLAQVLGYLHLNAQSIRRSLARHQWAKADQELDEMASLAHEAYLDVREAILGLRETISPPLGIVGTLREYLQKFHRQAGIAVDLKIEAERAPRFSPQVEVQLVRVIQEALTNVRKHADADRAWISIGSQNGEVSITVEDNGQGFDTGLLRDVDHRFGLRTMRERVERVGGRFDIESSPGRGTRVRICFPQIEGEE